MSYGAFRAGSENAGYRRERLPSNVFKMAYAIIEIFILTLLL